MEYNYFSSYGDYGSPTTLIPKKTVDDITANAPEELDTFKEVADKIKEIGGSDIDIDTINKKIDDNKSEADAKFEEINSVLDSKADTDALANLATKDEVEQVKSDVQTIIQDAPEELDTLKEIADLLATKEDASDVIEALSTKVSTSDFNAHVSSNDASFAEINEALSNKADSSELENYATSDYVDEKVPSSLSELTNDMNYVQDANYVHTDNNFSTEDKDKLDGLNNYDETELVGRVEAIENADYVTTNTMNSAISTATQDLLSDETDPVFSASVAAGITQTDIENWNSKTDNVGTITGITMNGESVGNEGVVNLGTVLTSFEEIDPTVPEWAKAETKPTYTAAEVGAMSTEHPANAITAEKMDAWDNKADSDTNTTVTGVDIIDDDDEGRMLTIKSSDDTSVSVSVTKIFDATQYYTQTETNRIFIDESEANTLVNNAVSGKADVSTLNSTVHELVVRLNKLEAQNAILVEKGTDNADDITGMADGDALNADIVVATDEAIEALSTPKTFNSITIAGGEVGDNTVINLLAKDSIDVNGLTVSGTKGNGNGKIVYGSNDITISNVNIEPGCTVYNVFEGKQDKAEDNLVENFTATNVIVDDIDLRHNVFNIYQLADGANILVKDSRFNLNVANSNIMRVSNITNAKNVTITFENIDWTYENKPYTDADKAWAGLLIYQPYSTDDGCDAGIAMEKKAVHTWTINVKNCRYNGEPIADNFVGTIKQAVYQYDVNKSGATEAPNAFGSVIVE